ncbi:hypothetical protein SISNIDRAFT_396033, partial [Sistotremastrum niveocremeum HHB9708]
LVNGQRAKCLFDSGCETVLCSPEFQTACKLPRFLYEKPCHLQLAVKGSKSAINYSTEATFNVNGLQVRSNMDVANIDNYEVIIGVPLLRKLKVSMHFAEVCRLEANGSPVPIFEPKVGHDMSAEEVSNRIDGWVSEYADVFGEQPLELPPFRAVNHEINLIDEKLVLKYRMPRCPDELKSQLFEKIQRYTAAQWWFPKKATSAAPMLCVLK